ncbi:DUF5615 family PIN-like protein [Candidatus Sumerlaeota bacterium]|nr:DUF5615 family PIN-like protein [Candidatus Sumerlaeota bacterium]
MRFLVDECTGPRVAQWLRDQRHEVSSVFDQARGADDENVIRQAFQEDRIVITNDKDFGEKVFRDGLPNKGVVLLRLEDERPENKIRVLKHLLENYEDRLTGSFTVVDENRVRFATARIPPLHPA